MGLILWCTEPSQQGADRIETLASRTLYNDRWNRPALILHTYPRAASTKTIAIKPRFTARIHVPKLAWETDTSTDQGPSVVTNEVLKYALHIVWNTSLQFLEMSILIYSCVNNTPRHNCLPAWQMGLFALVRESNWRVQCKYMTTRVVRFLLTRPQNGDR